MDATVIVALIAAIAAIVSPLITAIATNHKEIRLKKLDLVFTQKLKSVNDFTDSYLALTGMACYTEVKNFQASALRLSVICENQSVREKIIKLEKEVTSENHRTEQTDILYHECIIALSKETQMPLR